jgi:hypothetical protein
MFGSLQEQSSTAVDATSVVLVNASESTQYVHSVSMLSAPM